MCAGITIADIQSGWMTFLQKLLTTVSAITEPGL